MTVGIAYLDGPRLARAVFAASDWVAAGRDEINRINVFPVPDGDTGTNFSLTLRSVADALRALGDAPLPATAGAMARAAVLGARGNSGMMLAHFLLGFADGLGQRNTADAGAIAGALREGADRLYASLDDPREGTILTVARETAVAAEAGAVTSPDLGEFMGVILVAGDAALGRAFCLYPLMTFKVIAGIYWEALLIWLKGIRLHHRPPPPDQAVTIGHSAMLDTDHREKNTANGL